MRKLLLPRGLIKPTRRAFIAGAAAVIASPAIVRAQLTATGVGGGFGPAAGGGGTTSFDPANKSTNLALTNGNLTVTSTGSLGCVRSLASHSSGKYYAEMTVGAAAVGSYKRFMGFANSSSVLDDGAGSPDANSGGLYNGDATLYRGGGAASSTGINYAESDLIAMAFDITNSRIWYRKNGGDWNNNAANDPTAGTSGGGVDTSAVSGPFFAYALCHNLGDETWNFGGTAYAGAVPSGYSNW